MNHTYRVATAAMVAGMLLFVGGCEKKRVTAKVPAPPSIALAAPRLMSPPPDIQLHGYPRTTTVAWYPVEGAARYQVEVDYLGCGDGHEWCMDTGNPPLRSQVTPARIYTFDFVGDQPGRWRVWAIGADGSRGQVSEWRQFTYGRVLGGSILPPRIPPIAEGAVKPCPADFALSHFGSGTTPPRAVYNPDPEYTDAARKAKVSGELTLGIWVGEDGSVKDACVQRSLRPDLDRNGVAAVRTWKFEPARNGDAAIPAQLNVTVNFKIQ